MASTSKAQVDLPDWSPGPHHITLSLPEVDRHYSLLQKASAPDPSGKKKLKQPKKEVPKMPKRLEKIVQAMQLVPYHQP